MSFRIPTVNQITNVSVRIVTWLSDHEMELIKNAFDLFADKEQRSMSVKDLKPLLNLLNEQPTESELNDLISDARCDLNGRIPYHNLVDLITQRKTVITETEFINVFNHVDTNCNGEVSRAEMKDIMLGYGQTISDGQLDEIFEVLDVNKDGHITYEVFKKYMLSRI